jgi:hypothetical protein
MAIHVRAAAGAGEGDQRGSTVIINQAFILSKVQIKTRYLTRKII